MATVKSPGLFITLEGIDGCGKSTQAMMLYNYFQSLKKKVLLFREPGSTPVAEKIRTILLNKKLKIEDVTELLLYQAARFEVTAREIKPALNAGTTIICDRYYDSTTAYQGYGRQLDIRMVKSLHKIATGGLVPDITLLFDIDLKTAATRRGKKKDRLESQSKAFFTRVRNGFLEIARKERRRMKVIDATAPIDAVFKEVLRHVDKKLSK